MYSKGLCTPALGSIHWKESKKPEFTQRKAKSTYNALSNLENSPEGLFHIGVTYTPTLEAHAV